MSETLLNVTELTKIFRLETGEDLTAVADVSFEIAARQVVGLIGESGSGKTTVARCIAGLTSPTKGRLEWKLNRPARVAMVFQEPRQSLNPRFRTWESIADPLYLSPRPPGITDAIATVARVAPLVELTISELMAFPRELSDETLQRVSLARALVMEPDLLIMDEPTSSLDAIGRSAVLALILRLCRETSLTVLLISHDLNAVEQVSDRILIMYLGSLVELGHARDIFGTPRHPYTKALLSSYLEPDPDKPPKPFELVGEIPNPLDRPPGCPLVSRCPIAIDACALAMPQLRTVAPEHDVACIRADEISAGSDDAVGSPAVLSEVSR